MPITRKNIVISFALLSTLFFMASLYQRNITYDEAFFAEQAWWLNQEGVVRSELYSDMLNWGERQYAYHKLHVWQIAAIDKMLGWSVYNFKSIVLIYLLVFLVFSYRFFTKVLTPGNNTGFFIFIGLFLFNTYIIQYGFEARPEIMMMSLGFLAFLSIRHAIVIESYSLIALAALLCGMTVLFHLNGLIFVFAGIVLLLFARKVRFLPVFLLISGLTSALYFADIVTDNAYDVAFEQLTGDPAVTRDSFSILDRIVKFLSAPKRFVSHLYDISLTILFLLLIYLNRESIRQSREIHYLLVYFIAAELGLALIGPDNKNMYLVLHMPFIVIIVALLLPGTINKISRPWIMYVLLIFYVITQFGHSIKIFDNRNSHIIAAHKKIIEYHNINSSDRILAPARFVFNEIDSANIKAVELLPLLHQQKKIEYTAGGIFKYAARDRRRYVILRPETLDILGISKTDINTVTHGYRLLGQQSDLYVFKEEK